MKRVLATKYGWDDGEMRAPLATRSNMEGGGSSASKDLLAKVKAASSDKGVSEMKEVRLCSFCTTLAADAAEI
jgi:hypothetical protein